MLLRRKYNVGVKLSSLLVNVLLTVFFVSLTPSGWANSHWYHALECEAVRHFNSWGIVLLEPFHYLVGSIHCFFLGQTALFLLCACHIANHNNFAQPPSPSPFPLPPYYYTCCIFRIYIGGKLQWPPSTVALYLLLYPIDFSVLSRTRAKRNIVRQPTVSTWKRGRDPSQLASALPHHSLHPLPQRSSPPTGKYIDDLYHIEHLAFIWPLPSWWTLWH